MADEIQLAASSPFEDPFTDSVDEIRGRLFDAVVDQYPDESTRPDTREGSLLWTAMGATSIVAAEQYVKLNEVLELSFVQTSRDPYLDYRGAELGVTRLAATGSSGSARFMGEDGTVVPLGTTVSTATDDEDEETYVFTTTEAGSVVALPDPTDECVAATDGAGNLTGHAVYKFIYVTYLNEFISSRGYTGPSPAMASALAVSANKVDVTIPDLTTMLGGAWAPDSPALEVKEVRVYRSYKLPGVDTEYSEYKLIGKIETNPELGGVVEDNVSDADFALIDDTQTGDGGLPDTNSTGMVDLNVVSEATGSGTNGIVGAIQLLDAEIPGIEAVSNAETLTGGSDAESNEDYSVRILEEARKSAGAGNVDDYIGWAKSISGVKGVNVVPEWSGPGTVRVVIAGEDNGVISDADKIEEVRRFIAGDIAIDDPTVAIPTATPAASGGFMAAGTYTYVYSYVNSGGGETLPSPIKTAVTTTGVSTVTLTGIPYGPATGGPAGVATVRVYRKLGSGAYGLVDEVPNVESTPASGVLPDIVDDTVQSGLADEQPRNGNSTSLYNGVAPIGAHVTVETITTCATDVDATIWPADGYTLSGEVGKTDLVEKLNTSLDDYFKSLQPGDVVKYVDVLNAIHDTAGVQDFTDVVVTIVDVGNSPVGSINLTLPDSRTAVYDPINSTFTEGAA